MARIQLEEHLHSYIIPIPEGKPMVTSKFTPDQKIQIVLKSIKTNMGTVELVCTQVGNPSMLQLQLVFFVYLEV